MKQTFRLDELTGEAYNTAVRQIILAPFTCWTFRDLAKPDFKAVEDLARVVGCKFNANGEFLNVAQVLTEEVN